MRPTKLTPDVHKRIVTLLRAGNYLETAAAAAGVTTQTVRNWMRRGHDGDGVFAEFAADVEAAISESEARDVALIGQHAGQDWRAAAWRLERRNPRRWGAKVHLTVRRELDAFFDALDLEFAGDNETLARVYRVATELGGPGEGDQEV